MRVIGWVALASAVIGAACQSTPAPAVDPQPDPTAQAAPPPPTGASLPAGTDIRLRIKEAVNPASVQRGQMFTAQVVAAVVATNGQVALPGGAIATAMITGALDKDGRSVLRINFLRINVNGVSHPFTVVIRDSQAGAVVTGEQRDEIGKQLGPGPGTILSLTPNSAITEGTEITVRTRDAIELKRM